MFPPDDFDFKGLLICALLVVLLFGLVYLVYRLGAWLA